MHLILCIDDRDGLSFGGKRLSSDRKLTEFLLDYTSSGKLWMNSYSAKLFPEGTVCVDEDFLHKAGEGEYCFLENTPLTDISGLESVTLCRWNRRYPSTVKFPRTLLEAMRLESCQDFPGNSHDLISVERYTL